MKWEADVERHRLDGLSLVFGVALTGLGILLISGLGKAIVTGSWIGPAVAILIGIGLLLAAPRPSKLASDEDASAASEA
jgi:hypothetical protein